jgi:hypothetical protein
MPHTLTYREQIALKLKLSQLPSAARTQFIQKVCEKLGQNHNLEKISEALNHAFRRLDSQKN